MNRGTEQRGTEQADSSVGRDQITLAGMEVARYSAGEDLDPQYSRRPYLHPVHTLAGVAMTEILAADHPHHYGISMAVPDVNGTSYWGGSTFVRDQGSTMLANHGQQVSLQRTARTSAGGAQTVREELRWHTEHGVDQVTETRTLLARLLPGENAWSLTWTSVLRPSGGAVTIGSPATNGRPGAGYGGIFWRLAQAAETQVLSVNGAGESTAHESDSPWLAINQRSDDTRTGLLLSQPGPESRRWFLRSTQYVGAGPMLAAETTVTIEPGSTLTTTLRGIVLDRWIVDAADAERLLAVADRAADADTEESAS